MRVYVSSTSDDLERHRLAALEAARELGIEPIVRDPAARRGLSRVEACGRQVTAADLLLAIVGWRTGEVPGPELGGDGGRSWTEWEVRSAFDRGLPVTALMAGDSWPVREQDANRRAAMRDFRGELDRLAVRFDGEPGTADGARSLEDFRQLVSRRLLEARRGAPASAPGRSIEGLRLRRWAAPELPARPYPLLLPYTHPELLAGRERELAELRQLLTLPMPILGLYAASGAGKSSLLAAGLVPGLRAEGRPVAFDRHPCEAGLTGRLIRDLLEADDERALELLDPSDGARSGPGAIEAFVDCLVAARQMAGEAPVLVLDQFEDLLRRSGARRARAVVGLLLAASAQRQPGLDGPPCRWILAYRQESHGEVCRWLADVLADARAEGIAPAAALPHDLSGPDRFHGWPLQPLGSPAPGAADRAGAAAAVFAAAIERPLKHYPWRFAAGGAARLARAFGAARAARPAAPLVPELQVVLAHLLDRAEAGTPENEGTIVVEVPEEPAELIDQALEQHLRRALDAAFPAAPARRRRPGARPASSVGVRAADARAAGVRIEDPKINRTRALLALRELADAPGRRREGLPAESLARAIGAEGQQVLERLATPETRLVVQERLAGGWGYLLSHDRMAELLVRLVDEGAYGDLGIDAELLALRRFVRLKSELFAAGEQTQATRVPADHARAIEKHRAALLWGDEDERWWRACRDRARAEGRRQRLRRAAAAAALVATVAVAWGLTDRRSRRVALFEEVAVGEPEAAFAAADRLLVEWRAEPDELRAALRQRDKPLDLLERGIGGVAADDGRGEAVLRLAELVLPLIVGEPDGEPEDPVRIASLVWALDVFASPGERARVLRDRALEPLRRRRWPPPRPAAGDPAWADIPAGTFEMGSGPGEGRDSDDKLDERPRHRVTLSAFRVATHEVTNAQFRRLYPDHGPGLDDRLPAGRMTWYQAYTYAAWLGGRLPTEAEAEYVLRAGCEHTYCRRDGSAASLGELGWWVGNSMDPATGDPQLQPVGQLEPNPWGLYDVYGNVWELCADWYDPYSAEDQTDPPGPTDSSGGFRAARGGSVFDAAAAVAAPSRGALPIGVKIRSRGLRVVLPY